MRTEGIAAWEATAWCCVIVKRKFEEEDHINSLVNMFESSGKPMNARTVFDLISERNVITWTFVISDYTWCVLGGVAILFPWSWSDKGIDALWIHWATYWLFSTKSKSLPRYSPRESLEHICGLLSTSRTSTMGACSRQKCKQLEAWAIEEHLVLAESMWPCYCRTTTFWRQHISVSWVCKQQSPTQPCLCSCREAWCSWIADDSS